MLLEKKIRIMSSVTFFDSKRPELSEVDRELQQLIDNKGF
jgi:hypothetical protein